MVYYSLDVFGFHTAGLRPANEYMRTQRKESYPYEI